MYVMIAGGGRTAEQLAVLLTDAQHEVKVIEHRPHILALLHRELPTEVIWHGDPTDPQQLVAAGIEHCRVLAAMTDSDADNLALCFHARERYGVPRTIARVNNPRSAWLFGELFHVDVALNASAVMAALIEEEMGVGDMLTLLKLNRGRYSLVSERIAAGAAAVGQAIRELDLPSECVIAAILRDGEIVVPRGMTELAAGDELLAVCDGPAARQLAALLGAG